MRGPYMARRLTAGVRLLRTEYYEDAIQYLIAQLILT